MPPDTDGPGVSSDPPALAAPWPYPIHDVDPSDPNTMGCICTCDGCRSGNCHAKGSPMNVSQQMPDGSWVPAEPIGWQEEHGWFARFIFWLRRVEHCNDREGQRKLRRW